MVSRFAVIVIALLGGAAASGCLPLMIGGLAYQGYEYTKEKKEAPAAEESRKESERKQQPAPQIEMQ